jgi:hypothetical protein
VASRSRVVDSRETAAMFGFALDDSISLARIFERWSSQLQDRGVVHSVAVADSGWLESTIEQTISLIDGRFPVVAWSPLEVASGRTVLPFVSRCRTIPATGGLQVQLHFLPVSNPPVAVPGGDDIAQASSHDRSGSVFVSYAHDTLAKVDILRSDVEFLAGRVWLDNALAGGQIWWDEILREIRDCRLFVLALSHEAVRSEACQLELAYAAALQRPVLVVRISEVEMAA